MTKRAAKRGAANRGVKYRVVPGATIRRDESRYLMNTYKRPAVVFTHGKGSYLYDDRGGKYLDFLGGIAVNSLGYSHPRIVKVIRREAGRAIHLSNLFHNQFQGPLARKLAAWSHLDRVFFTNSGTEAVEGALKIARAHARARAANGSAAEDAHSCADRVLSWTHVWFPGDHLSSKIPRAVHAARARRRLCEIQRHR